MPAQPVSGRARLAVVSAAQYWSEVTRKLPSEIDIRVVERKPVAWITSEKQISDPFASDVAFLVDARGVLMKEKKLLPEYLGLPLITGCTSESLEPRLFCFSECGRSGPRHVSSSRMLYRKKPEK